MTRTQQWKPGDVVSSGHGDTTSVGKVIELRRRSDGKPFLMISLTGGAGRIGSRHYTDGWFLGTGPREHRCLECGYTYRTDETRADFCPACVRDQNQTMGVGSSDHETRSNLRRRLGRGKSDTPKPEPVSAVTTDDDFWSPF